MSELDVDYGLLYYAKLNEMIRVPLLRDEVRGLIQTRNELASFGVKREALPPMIKNMHTCQRCFSLDACATYHKVIDSLPN